MNALEKQSIRSPSGLDEECAKFIIDDISTPFVFHDIAAIGQEYTLSFYACSSVSGNITAGGFGMEIGTEWKRYVVTFCATSTYVPIWFNASGTYYLYHTKLEIGQKDTDFTVAPEDIDAAIYSAETIATQTSEKFNWIVKSGTSSTDFTLTDRTATLIAQTISLNGDVKVNGDMLVDGCITTSKLVSRSVTADKINTADLFAQNITATGSITGITLNSAVVNSTSGNIGGWEIESGALKSGGDTYDFSGSTLVNATTNNQITKSGVYLSASAGMARFVNCDSVYNSSLGKYINTVRETRIIGGTTTGYKATYDYLYSDYASLSGDVYVEDWSGALRRPVTSINNSQYCVSHFQSNSSSLTVTGAWAGSELTSRSITITSSDIRLKKNIRKTDVEALPIINQIGMYQFDWRQDGLHQKIGFIADYLEQQDEHFSVGGGYDDDGIMNVKAVDNFYLMGYVVKGMQELSKMATRADARLRDVETVAYSAKTEVDSLNAKVSSLEYQLQQAYMIIATLEKQLLAAG